LNPKDSLSDSDLLTILTGHKVVLHEPYVLYSLVGSNAKELTQLEGVGKKGARRIQAAFELAQRIYESKHDKADRISCPADAASWFLADMAHLEQEQLRVMLLNTRNDVMGTVIIYQGTINTTITRVAEIFRPAIRFGAMSIILAHNHPSGDAQPSVEDIAMTRTVIEAGNLMDIEVLDHLIIGRNKFSSLKDAGCFSY